MILPFAALRCTVCKSPANAVFLHSAGVCVRSRQIDAQICYWCGRMLFGGSYRTAEDLRRPASPDSFTVFPTFSVVEAAHVIQNEMLPLWIDTKRY